MEPPISILVRSSGYVTLIYYEDVTLGSSEGAEVGAGGAAAI